MNTPWQIVSYPRSGNHIIRGLLEAYSGRPTLGCPRKPNDSPIFERSSNQRLKVIKISDPTPIGYKAHWVKEIRRNNRLYSSPPNLLLITRNPIDAISSHLSRQSVAKNTIEDKINWFLRGKPSNIKRATDLYLETIMYYRSFKGPKIHLKFEDLVCETWQQNHLPDVMSKMTGKSIDPTLNVSDIMLITKESQQSLSPNMFEEKQKLSLAVSRHINYKSVLDLLELK